MSRQAQNNYNMKNERLNESTEGLLTALSRLQRALGDMTQCVEAASEAVRPQENAAKGA